MKNTNRRWGLLQRRNTRAGFCILHGFAVLFSLFITLAILHETLASTEHQDAPAMPLTQASRPVDEATTLKVQEGYGKLPLYFIQNDGQVNENVRFYEKGAGHATYFTKRGVYLSLAGRAGQEAGANEIDYGPRITENGIQSTLKPLDLFLTSYCNPIVPSLVQSCRWTQKISVQAASQNQQIAGNTRTNDPCSQRTGTGFVRTTSGSDAKSQTCGEQSRTIRNPQSEIVRLMPLGANKHPEIVAEGLQAGKVNYLIGNDPSKWKTNIPTYKAVVYQDVYQDIDMKFYGNNRQMEYDIIVKPGANPSRVQLSYEGIEGLMVAEKGDLEISLKEGKLIQKKPYVYQEIDGKRVEREGRFKIRNHKSEIRNSQCIYGFQVAAYDKRYPLVIDPTLEYSTFLGGGRGDGGAGIAVDTSGNAYVTGGTGSSDFPTTASAYDSSFNGRGDVFVTKLDASGSSLVYSTFLGGGGGDAGVGIVVDTSGNAYITGLTSSSRFPTTASAYDRTFNGGQNDVFVTMLDASGSNLVYSTFLGGGDTDHGEGIAVDTSGNAYVTGRTFSSDFPTTASAYDRTFNGWYDVFVTKLDASGNSLVYSTFLGGGDNYGRGIAVDTSGHAYVTGLTGSSDFPTTASAYDSTFNGVYDGFVTRLDVSGSSLIYSTFLGGGDVDFGEGITVDTSGHAYVTGVTYSSDFPTTVSAYDRTYNGGGQDTFVTKLDASGSNLVYSTFLGGDSYDIVEDITVDTSENAYVTGYTGSSNFPTTESAYDRTHNGNYDVFVTRLDATGSSLAYSTFLGGGNSDSVSGIAVDTTGNAYVTGGTSSSDFPTTASAYDRTHNGNGEVFVAKILFSDITPTPTPTPSPTPSPAPCPCPGSMACYTFEEGDGNVAGDSSGNGNDGAIIGATWTNGKSGGGLSFDGVDDEVSIPALNSDEVSVCAWFYKYANDTSGFDFIFGGLRTNANPQLREGFGLKFFKTTPNRVGFVLVTKNMAGWRTQRTVSYDLGNSVGSWYHVAVTYNRTTGEQKLYVNGQLVGTVRHPAGNSIVPLASAPDMKIGNSLSKNSHFNGIIDEVCVYDRSLSDQEVLDIYNNP